ncbi:MAG: DsrE family protein, partial [Acidobacteria bacterium]|nr:DsrE family protein [Acidobacteriota bacterium]
KSQDGVFIHVSHGVSGEHGPDHAQRVLMAFKMADVMSSDKPVAMYFDIDAVHLLLKGGPDVSAPGFDSSKAMIAKLLKAGVKMYVCPACLKAAGRSESDVLDGVQIANKDAFFAFTSGRILSLSY